MLQNLISVDTKFCFSYGPRKIGNRAWSIKNNHQDNRRSAMTKAELVEKAAKDAKVSKVAAAAALNSFMGNVTKALKKKNGKVTLVGFGTFSKVRRKARKGRNPQTGEVIKIKASNVVKFSPGKKLKDAV